MRNYKSVFSFLSNKKALRIITTILFHLIIFCSFGQSQYSIGFKDGFENGYCYGKGAGCIKPVSPVAPVPHIGESSESYTQGYNRGFIEGRRKQENKENYSTIEKNLKVNTQPTYIPQIHEFKPDWDFYWKALDRAHQQQQKQQYLQYQQQVQQQYIAEQKYKRRVNYINQVKDDYSSIKGKPKVIPDGYYTVFVTALNDYRDQIKVYVEDNKITRYYWDNYYEATVISSSNIERGKAVIRIDAMGVKTGDMDVYFMDFLKNPNIKTSPPLKPSFVVLYATKKKQTKYEVSIGKTYLGKASKVFKDEVPNYGDTGTISFYLKPGTYSIGIKKSGLFSVKISWIHITLKENGVLIHELKLN